MEMLQQSFRMYVQNHLSGWSQALYEVYTTRSEATGFTIAFLNFLDLIPDKLSTFESLGDTFGVVRLNLSRVC